MTLHGRAFFAEVFKETEFEGCCEVDHDGSPWLRFDIPDSDPKEQWDEYIDVIEGLKRLGIELIDPLVEHDCISGDLKFMGDKT